MKYVFLFFLVLLIPLVIAENNSCSGDICQINSTIQNDTEEQINCDNFKWVEEVSAKVYSMDNTTLNAQTFTEILKETNYRIQNDLNKCEKDLRHAPNRGIFYFSILVTIIMVIWKIYDITKK